MKQIDELVEQLQQAKEAYYNAAPIMTDAEFDALEDQLRELAPDHVYFTEVGTKPKSSWRKVKHGAPMGSLKKVQTFEQFRQWSRSLGDDTFILSEKLDGISISLRYTAGKFVQAVTRGDGEVGEDITSNVKLMQGVPKKMRGGFTGYIRGEIVLFKSDHREHVPEYKNPRNAAAGIAKREADPSRCKYLRVLCYQAIDLHEDFERKADEFFWLEARGFTCPHWQRASSRHVEIVYARYVEERRAVLDYDIDGLVVELDDLEAMEELGSQDGRPRGARAFKFPHDEGKTKLVSVVWQTGHSGRVTPVAYFKPVTLAGASVSQASLHNVGNIKRLWCDTPRVGDTLLVSRRNDVIPYVEKIVRTGKGTMLLTPSHCPSCGYGLTLDGAYLVCGNDGRCPAQQSGAIKRWVKKLDIKEWGDTLINTLCQEGHVRSIADLYRLEPRGLAAVKLSGKKLGDSSAKKALRNLHAKMTLPLADLVGAMGIDLWGQSMCQVLVDAGFDTLKKLEDATVDDLVEVPGVGLEKAEAFVHGFRHVRPTIRALLATGIKVRAPVTDGALSGKSFCFTGIRNKELEGRIKDAGGKVKTSVGKGLSYLVAKDPKSTSGKAKKAREQGVSVIGLADLEAMLG